MEAKHALTWQGLSTRLAEAQQGRQESGEEVFAFLRGRLLSLARYRVQEAAEDIVQETLVIVHNHLPEFHTLENLIAFAHQVLRNKVGNIYQGRDRQKRREVDWQGVAEPEYHITGELEAAELDRIVRESIAKLKARRPACGDILACLYNGFDPSEISATLGISKSRLKVQTFRCRESLREILLQEYGWQV
jgi:RNA polymerase sigma factor (sigma-70 family)